jgi:hypothetical protein
MSKLETNTIDTVSGTSTLTLGGSNASVVSAGTEVRSNKLSPASGTALQIGDSGDTITIPSGATIVNSGTQTGFGGTNTPAFLVKFSENVTDQAGGTTVKAPYNTEIYDTHNAYDNSTHYRFTVPSGEGGKYYIFMHQHLRDQGQNDNYSRISGRIFKNGSFFTEYQRGLASDYFAGNLSNYISFGINMDLSAGDYIEFKVVVYDTNFKFMEEGSYAGGYKLIT